MAEKQFNKGDVIFHQGDEGNDLYQILEGSVGFYVSYDQDDRQKISEAGKGEFFGEMAVIDACPRSADAIALEDGTRIREISASDLNAFFREDPDSITGIMKVLSTRIRDLTDQYDNANAAASRIGAEPRTEEVSLPSQNYAERDAGTKRRNRPRSECRKPFRRLCEERREVSEGNRDLQGRRSRELHV